MLHMWVQQNLMLAVKGTNMEPWIKQHQGCVFTFNAKERKKPWLQREEVDELLPRQKYNINLKKAFWMKEHLRISKNKKKELGGHNAVPCSYNFFNPLWFLDQN